jgi:hypothetical protein
MDDFIQYYTVATLAERWAVCKDKVTRVLEKWRGKPGFLDLGSPENVRLHKRRHAMIRIHPSLLKEIEGGL